jgi:hypothetical protein
MTPTTTTAAAARKPTQIQVSFSASFEDNHDNDMWIPLDLPPPILPPSSSDMQEELSHPTNIIYSSEIDWNKKSYIDKSIVGAVEYIIPL